MPVVENISEITDIPTAIIPDIIDPLSLVQPNGEYVNYHTDTFRDDIFKYLGAGPSPHAPALIKLHVHPFEWPCDVDPMPVVACFGKILRIRDDVRILASKALHTFNQRYGLGMNLTNPKPKRDSFIGAHLRTEEDFRVFYTNYDAQTKAYFGTIEEKAANDGLNYTNIYVASGDLAETEKFRKDGTARGFTVSTKYVLLTDERDLQYLNETLSWDEAGLVDYLVLLKSGFFIGPGLSSYSDSIAITRYGIGGWTGRGERMTWPGDGWSKVDGIINGNISPGHIRSRKTW